jgi:preprotein translocase subunit Sec63
MFSFCVNTQKINNPNKKFRENEKNNNNSKIRETKKKNQEKRFFFSSFIYLIFFSWVILSFCVQNVATIEKLERHYKLLGR